MKRNPKKRSSILKRQSQSRESREATQDRSGEEKSSNYTKRGMETKSPGVQTPRGTDRECSVVSKVKKLPVGRSKNSIGDKNSKKKPIVVLPTELLRDGDFFEGMENYRTINCMRNAGPHGEYRLRIDDGGDVAVRLEPMGRTKLKFIANAIYRLNRITEDAEKNFVALLEYGTQPKLGCNFMITTTYGPNLEEVRKSVLKAPYTTGCAFNIAQQCLNAIKWVHLAGFVHRNIKPSCFVTGDGKTEKMVLLHDFRIARIHIDPITKQAKPPRETLKWLGTARYASRAQMRLKDAGRMDDLESWIYTVYNIIDENSLPWRRSNKENTLANKDKFFEHKLRDVYKTVPAELQRLVDYVKQLEYKSEPDYKYIFNFLEAMIVEKKIDTTLVDWAGKVPMNIGPITSVEKDPKSEDNKCSGHDDFEEKGRKDKERAERKKMEPGDMVKNDHATWKVEHLLGSGGFGDVYKVYNPNAQPVKYYALKTESESGKKTMLRLKVEMQVMKTIQDEKKKNPGVYRHFVDFIDRGRNEQLKIKFIVMSLVGPSLEDIRRKYLVDLSKKGCPYLIAINTLEAIKDLHTIGFLHRDIKPANFAVGIGVEESLIYVLDFGIARGYMEPGTKKLRAPRVKVKFLGTLRYASRACMTQKDQGRKDDLECWLYMTFDLMDEENGIPWRQMKGADKNKILMAKELFFNHQLDVVYENITKKMKSMIDYVDKMEFQTEPNYDQMINMITTICQRQGYTLPKKPDWVGKLSKVPEKAARLTDDSDDEGDSAGEEED